MRLTFLAEATTRALLAGRPGGVLAIFDLTGTTTRRTRPVLADACRCASSPARRVSRRWSPRRARNRSRAGGGVDRGGVATPRAALPLEAHRPGLHLRPADLPAPVTETAAVDLPRRTPLGGALERRYRPGQPVAIGAILGCFRHGAGDPTFRRDDAGIWLGRHTPAGAGTLLVRAETAGRRGGGAGPGARGRTGCSTACPRCSAPRTTGAGSSPTTRRSRLRGGPIPGWRMPRSRLVLDSLVPAVIEQKVTGKEAFAAYRTLVWRFGDPAPGPREGLRLAPTAARWRGDPVVGVPPRRA